jgi:hypothetical protein
MTCEVIIYSTLSNIYKCKKSILGTLDLEPLAPIEYHASYLPTKCEIHLSINKGCMGKNVKCILSIDDLDQTEPKLHPKEEYNASYLPTKYEIDLSINIGCMGKSVKTYF